MVRYSRHHGCRLADALQRPGVLGAQARMRPTFEMVPGNLCASDPVRKVRTWPGHYANAPDRQAPWLTSWRMLCPSCFDAEAAATNPTAPCGSRIRM
jgi:hypothetical protein